MDQEHETEQPESLPTFDEHPPAIDTDSAQTPSYSERAKRSSGSPWPILIAVVLGGLLAVGIVKMIPESWLPRRKSPSPVAAKSSDGEKSKEFDPFEDDTPNGPSDAEQLAAPSKTTDPTPPRRIVKQTQDDPATRIAREREEEAASLLRRAKALQKIHRNDDAVALIERLLNQYADTKVAVEAEKTLRAINRR